jgi:uncharacterized protein
MNSKIAFFAIPATDIQRAIKFYKNVFDFDSEYCDCPDQNEKMGMIQTDNVLGCVFWSPEYKPSKDGSQLSFEVDNINSTLEKIEKFGGKTIWGKCKINADNMGFCALFTDCEGNTVGLYSKN